jgi:hypothetical protein
VFGIFIWGTLALFSSFDNKPVGDVLNPVFGKVKPPVLTEATSSGKFTYDLETIEGDPVTATGAAEVYFLKPSAQKFGYVEKIKKMATVLGFDSALKQTVIGKNAAFVDDKRKLSIDISNFNFEYKYDLTKDPTVLGNPIPQQSDVISMATDVYKNLDTYPEELAQGKTNVVYLKINPTTNELAIVQRPIEANAVEVDFYRPDLDGYPVVSPKYFNSQNYVVLGFNSEGKPQTLRARLAYYEKSTDQVGVYPVKDGAIAYEQLKNGLGMVVSGPSSAQNITIKKMFFGYLDPDTEQDYLEPVYIFLGDNNFVAYVAGIDDKYLISPDE